MHRRRPPRPVPLRRARATSSSAELARRRRRGRLRRRDGAVPRGRARRLLVGAARRPRRAGAPRRPRGARGHADDGPPRRVGRRLPGVGRRRAATWPPARGASTGRMFRVPSATLGELARAWFPFGVHLIEGFFQTVRSMDSLSRQREALIALGTLAAGLAHEINNPASATARAVDALQDTCDTLLSSLVRLAETLAAAEQFVALDALRREIDASAGSGRPAGDRRPRGGAQRLARRPRRRRRRGGSPRRSPAAGVDAAWCRAGRRRPRRRHARARTRLGGGHALAPERCSSEMKESTRRDLRPGRRGEVVLAARPRVAAAHRRHRRHREHAGDARRTSSRDGVTVVRDYGADVPRIEANPGELNQVWTNLIDNAIDAMDGERHAAHLDARSTATTSSSRSPTPAPGCRPRCRRGRSSRSSRPRTSARAPVSGSTSRGASSSTATTATSTSTPDRTKRCCACASHTIGSPSRHLVEPGRDRSAERSAPKRCVRLRGSQRGMPVRRRWSR